MAGRFTYSKRNRLGGRGTFSRIFDQKVKQTRGALTMYAAPNGLEFSRLGISIGRVVGTAPKRNRIKRLLRESFRVMKGDLERGYDLVIVVRPHKALELAEYQKLVSGLAERMDQMWAKREKDQRVERDEADDDRH